MKTNDSGRPSGRVNESAPEAPVRRRKGSNSDNDCRWSPPAVNSRPRRLGRRQIEALRRQLSARELSLISTLVQLRWATGHQLQRLFASNGTPLSNVRRGRALLLRLTEFGVVQRLDRRIGGVRAGSGGFIYCPTSTGAAVAAGPEGLRRTWTASEAFIDHTLAVTELYVQATEAHRAGTLELLEFQLEPDCWRDFSAPIGRVIYKPDAFLRIGHGDFEDLWFVEVDRGTESRTALLRKFRVTRQYAASGREQHRHGVFPRVLWLVPSVKRLRQLLDVAGQQPPDSWNLFGVRLFDEAIGHLAQERPS